MSRDRLGLRRQLSTGFLSRKLETRLPGPCARQFAACIEYEIFDVDDGRVHAMASDVLRLTVFNTCRSCLLLQRSARQRIATSPVALCAARPISSSAKQRAPSHAEAPGLPRWQQTPPKATMPVRFRPRRQGEFEVNNDPGKLDKALASFFSDQRSPIPLSEEVKWLAVTHKSFDHGRRGFNDRLAFLGIARHVCFRSACAFMLSRFILQGNE